MSHGDVRSWSAISVVYVAFAAVRFGVAAQLTVPKQHATIQAAIDASVNGDEVVVSPGTYTELINFNGKAITLRSAEGAATTCITGGRMGTVVLCVSGEVSLLRLRGHPVRRGCSPGVIHGQAQQGRQEAAPPHVYS